MVLKHAFITFVIRPGLYNVHKFFEINFKIKGDADFKEIEND